jgi:hypothetical protein
MSDITRQQNFTNGDLVTAEKLKNLIDNSSISPQFLYNKSILFADTLSLNDYLLIYDSSINSYMKTSVGDFVKGGILLSDTGLKFHRYDNPSSPYGNTWLYSVTPVQNAYCGFLLNSTGGSNGQTINTGNFGTLDISSTSSLIGIFSGQTHEVQNFGIYAGGAISRGGWGNTGSITFRTQGNATDFFNDWTITQDAQVNANYSSVYKIEKEFDRYDIDGYQDGGIGRKTVKAIEIGQKVVDNKATDTVEIRMQEELTVPTVNATTVDATTFKKAGTASVFPLKRGYSEFESGNENSAYIGVPDTVLASGFTIHSAFKVNAVASGGSQLWESVNPFSLLANEVYFLTIDIWHNELSTQGGAWMDYRLRLKPKTVGGATYPMREIAVRRQQIASSQGTCNHRLVFKIERSDFPVGGEDVTRQLLLHLTESNHHLAYRHYIIRASAEIWNKADITAGNLAAL